MCVDGRKSHKIQLSYIHREIEFFPTISFVRHRKYTERCIYTDSHISPSAYCYQNPLPFKQWVDVRDGRGKQLITVRNMREQREEFAECAECKISLKK